MIAPLDRVDDFERGADDEHRAFLPPRRVEQGPLETPVAADDDITSGERANELDTFRRLPCFAQLWPKLDLELTRAGERFGSLEAPPSGARQDRLDRIRVQPFDEPVSLLPPALVQGTFAIVALPLVPVARGCMANEQERHLALTDDRTTRGHGSTREVVRTRPGAPALPFQRSGTEVDVAMNLGVLSCHLHRSNQVPGPRRVNVW